MTSGNDSEVVSCLDVWIEEAEADGRVYSSVVFDVVEMELIGESH